MAFLITVGLEKTIHSFIEEIMTTEKIHKVESIEDFENFIEDPPDIEICSIVVGTGLADITANEISQSFRMIAPNTEQILITTDREQLDTVQLLKDGFNICSLFPIDRDAMQETLEDLRAKDSGEKIYRSVLFTDIEAGAPVDFDIHLFLPANKKYIRYVKKGNSLDSKQFKKITTESNHKAYIASNELKRFYEQTSKRLMELNQEGVSGTEKRESLKTSVRLIFSEIFSSSENLSNLSGRKKTMESAGKIVQNFIDYSSDRHLLDVIKDQVGSQKSSYSHQTNVSIYSCLFSLALGVSDPGAMAIAGLIHDLGKEMLPGEIRNKK